MPTIIGGIVQFGLAFWARNSRSQGEQYAVAMRPLSRRGSRGQSLAELAIILPIMLLLVLAALDLSRVFYTKITVTNAAKEAALVAASGSGTFTSNAACNASTNTVMCGATSEAAGGFVKVLPANVAATTCASNAAFGATAVVTVRAPFQFITPMMGAFFGGQNITLSSSATAQCAVMPAQNVSINQSGQCTVPSLVGLSESVANGTWLSANFTGVVTRVGNGSGWTILAQTPSADSSAACTSGATIYKTAATTCTVPSIGKNWYFDDYQNAWTGAGFTGALTDSTGGKKVGSVSRAEGSSPPCTSTMTVNK